MQYLTSSSGQTLTGAYAATAGNSLRVGSKASIQFSVTYAKNAAEAAAHTKYADMYMEYTMIKDTEAGTGITDPADASWQPYKEEQDEGAGDSSFLVRHWKIYTDDVTNEIDLTANFSRPLLVERVRLQIREFGVAAFGTLTVRATAQFI